MVSQVLACLVVLLGLLSLCAEAYPGFQSQIPNGVSVPDPCNPGKTWPGVGHQSSPGGDARNQFGLAFFANNHVWNITLCKLDSDGDGKTNGAELGDPNCIWVSGAAPSPASGHPGVCEPVTSSLCQGKNNFLPASCLTPSATTIGGGTTTTSAGGIITTKKSGSGSTGVWHRANTAILAAFTFVAVCLKHQL